MKIDLSYDSGVIQDRNEDKPRFSPIPADEYEVILVQFDVQKKDTHVGGKAVFEIQGGEYDGRLMYDYLVVTHNTSEKANQIGIARIVQWADAVGVDYEKSEKDGQVSISLDTDELLHKPVRVYFKVEPERVVHGETKPAQNRAARFMPSRNSSVPKSAMKVAKLEKDDSLGDWD